MRIPLTATGLISNVLANAGAKILTDLLADKAQHFENIFDKDEIPEEKRIGAKCTVVTFEYFFTLERLNNKSWALSGFEYIGGKEVAQSQQKTICC